MAKRSDGDVWKVLGVLLAVVGLIYLQTGRGKDNAPLIPDALEDPMDRVVSALNQRFGHPWVTMGLDVLQAYIQGTMPGAVSLVNAVYRAEQLYGHSVGMSGTKKQAAMRYALSG